MARTKQEAYRLTRRRFMGVAGAGIAGSALIAACGDDNDDEPAATQAPADTQPPANTQAPAATQAPSTAAGNSPSQDQRGTLLIQDVIEYSLDSEEWMGNFGFVTFRLHTGRIDDEPVYFIRTDASDQEFATAEGLVFAPRMASALAGGGEGLSSIYLFEGGPDDQTPVLSTAPHMDDFSPAFRVHLVSFTGAPERLGSVSAIEQAASAGEVEVEQTDVVVNYPVVKWPGGELPVDDVKEEYLGNGQLLEPVDVSGQTVTFKLQACYTASRYIVTDVTMPPMATGMKIAPAPGAAALTDASATAQILVFGNGVEGSGPMGFQSSLTDTLPGDAAWSPFWDHYTFLWADSATPEVLKSPGALQEKEAAGKVERVLGTPDTGGQLFMVNCPVPVVAPLA